MMAIDWTAFKVEYVNSAMTYRELSEKYGVKEATVRKRVNREGWNDARHAVSQFVTSAATEQITENRVDELTKFNEQDLETAKAIRNKAIEMMGQIDTPSDLRALAGAVDVAQKVGRLALGASTENSAQTIRELPTLEDDGWLG
jgi:DNA-binding MurR/RpiR family transcriptional regulator